MRLAKSIVIPGAVILAVSAVSVAGWLPTVRLVQYWTAPKFEAMTYVETEQSFDCLAMITDAACYRIDRYRARGSEKALAQALVEELKGRGYELDPDPDKTSILCRGSGDYDLYSLINLRSKRKYSPTLEAKFYSSAGYEPISDWEIGCGGLAGDYRIDVTTGSLQN